MKRICTVLMLVLLVGCTKTIVINAPRPLLPVPVRPSLVLPQAFTPALGEKFDAQKALLRLHSSDLDVVIDTVYRAQVHIIQLESLITEYNKITLKHNRAVRAAILPDPEE